MTDDASYDKASEEALKRDGYTCQLCGTVGYPKTERGLAAVPIEPNQHRVEDLVTVCHDCLKKDDRQLQKNVQEAYKRRQRRTPDTSENTLLNQDGSEPASRHSVISQLQSTSRRLTTFLRSITISKASPDRDKTYSQVDRVGQKDNYNCQICSEITRPRGRVSYMMYPFRDAEGDDPEVNDLISVCLDCLEWEDDQTVEQKARKAGRLKNARKGLSLRYAKAVLRESKERARLFSHSGRLVIFRRAIATAVGVTGLLIAGVLLTGLLGALFVSPQLGISWAQATLGTYQTAGAVLLATPWIVLGALGIGYAIHVFEQEHAYEREVFRDERRRGETPSETHGRPRWQFVAGFAAVGLFGALDWILVRHDVFPDGMLFGALVFWTVGSAGVAYYLRQTLREERDIDGYPVNPAPWVFTSRYALFVALVGTATSSLTTRSLLPPTALELTLVLAPLVGAVYVGRRLAERRTVWGIRAMYSIRTAIDTIWPLDDDWPPTEQHQQQPNQNSTDTE